MWTDERIAVEAHRVAFLANGRETVAKIGMTMIRDELQTAIDDQAAEIDRLRSRLAELETVLVWAQNAWEWMDQSGLPLTCNPKLEAVFMSAPASVRAI